MLNSLPFGQPLIQLGVQGGNGIATTGLEMPWTEYDNALDSSGIQIQFNGEVQFGEPISPSSSYNAIRADLCSLGRVLVAFRFSNALGD